MMDGKYITFTDRKPLLKGEMPILELKEGIDEPVLDSAIFLRPTISFEKHKQSLNRSIRPDLKDLSYE